MLSVTEGGIILLGVAKAVEMWLARSNSSDLAHIKKVGDDTHTLSNSAMGVVLKDSAVKSHKIWLLTKRLAEITKEPADMSAVEAAMAEWVAAERFSGKHEGQQEIVDSGVAIQK
jgi:hypothetical protein